MKKLMGLLLLGFGVLLLSPRAEAAASVRGAKSMTNISYSTTVSTITANGPGVVYGVILSTGTAGTDYVSLFDIATVGAQSGPNTNFKARINVSSATQNTVVTFDPPLQFSKGIVGYVSSATDWVTIIWEPGHVTQGY